MDNADDDSQPLKHDTAREAVDSIRGYRAQIWRSVLAWIGLGDAETLYLEGAEDMDRISGSVAEAIQVKDTTGNVTLRSQDVIEAIDNAWDHQQRNPARAVKLRFLTTAGIGVERGGPFAAWGGGLQLWNDMRSFAEVAARHRGARAIAAFLLAEGKVSAPVRAFLTTSSDDEIWRRLIVLIEWDTDAEPVQQVIDEVRALLVIHGSERHVASDAAAAVAAHLCEHAHATAVSQKERRLTKADFLRIFDERTRRSLPEGVLESLLAAVSSTLVSAGTASVAAGGRASAVGRAPPLPARFYPRADLARDIAGRLTAYPILVLQGGTGKGKSLAVAGHLAARTGPWGWVDLRGVKAGALASLLSDVTVQLAAEEGLSNIVLDDLEMPDDARDLETPLVRIAAMLEVRAGSLIITSVTPLPSRIALALGLPASATIPVPMFSRDEIREFLVSRGCPSGDIAGWLAAFVEVHTSGHAQLVHARVAALEVEGFPVPDMESLMSTPAEIAEARTEARRLVALLDESARELAYRLSLSVQSFPRRQMFAIAALAPPIEEPGLAFDRLVGPWVETVGEGWYRISPLLLTLGNEVRGQEWARAMHGQIGHAMLGFRTLSPNDVSAILLHAMAAHDWAAAAQLAIGLMDADAETWEALAQSAGWFVAVGTGTAHPPDTDTVSLFLIRLMQVRLAVADRDPENILAIKAAMDTELPASVKEEPLRLMRYFFLASVLVRPDVRLPMSAVVPMSLEFVQLSDTLRTIIPKVHDPEFDKKMPGPDGQPDLAGIPGFTLNARIQTCVDFEALLDACETGQPELLRRLLWFMGGREAIAQLAFDRAWLTELAAFSPDWPACRTVFERVHEFGKRVNLPGLAHGAARVIMRVIGQNLRDPAQALRFDDAVTTEIGRSPGRDDERAQTLLDNGDPAGALAIWRELLPLWQPIDEFDIQQTFSHRLAAVAAERLQLWTQAADWLRKSWSLADPITQADYRAGVLVDEGFARWKDGDNAGALSALSEGLSAIDVLPPDDTDDRAYLVRKYAGHTIMWIAKSQAGRPPEGFSEPTPTFCSRMDPLNGPRQASTPSEGMWGNLLEFEFEAGLGDELFLAHEARTASCRVGYVRLSSDELRIRRRLKNLELSEFPEVVADWLVSIGLIQAFYQDGGLAPAEPLPADIAIPGRASANSQYLLGWMAAALFALAARGAMTRELAEEWRASAQRAGHSDLLEPWLNFVIELFVNKTMPAEAALIDRSLGWPYWIAASIKVGIDPISRPAELIVAHKLWSDASRTAVWGSFIIMDIERLVTTGWSRLAKSRFLLRTPAVTAPGLEQACASEAKGWRKVGEVLLAACDTVPGRLAPEFRVTFADLCRIPAKAE